MPAAPSRQMPKVQVAEAPMPLPGGLPAGFGLDAGPHVDRDHASKYTEPMNGTFLPPTLALDRQVGILEQDSDCVAGWFVCGAAVRLSR